MRKDILREPSVVTKIRKEETEFLYKNSNFGSVKSCRITQKVADHKMPFEIEAYFQRRGFRD